MTPAQSRMARAGLQWSIDDLKVAAGVGRMTVVRFEAGGAVADKSRSAIIEALEIAGAQFSRRSGRVGVTVPDGGKNDDG